MKNSTDIQLLYDRQCPLCELYCRNVDVSESAGRLVRIDAREPGEIMDEVTALGLDIDEGMVLKVDEQLYYGSEAIHELAKLSSRKGLFNRLASLTFRSPSVARMLYPVLKTIRNLLLKLLGRTRINNLELPDRDRF